MTRPYSRIRMPWRYWTKGLGRTNGPGLNLRDRTPPGRDIAQVNWLDPRGNPIWRVSGRAPVTGTMTCIGGVTIHLPSRHRSCNLRAAWLHGECRHDP